MNANELADKLEKCCLVSWGECNHEDYDTDIWTKMKSATMLRQQQAEIEKWTDQYQRLNENLEMWKAGHFKQQAEIEALKQIIDANNLSQNIGQFVKPDLRIEEVMSKHGICYKLGYSQLNNYRKVNNENNNEAA